MDRPSIVACILISSFMLSATVTISRSQTTAPDPKARCAELVAFWLRVGGDKGEGAGGADMTRKAAAADCEAGRYDAGIKAMEDLIRRNGYTVPPR